VGLEVVSRDSIARNKSQQFAYIFNNFYIEISRVVTKSFYGDLHLFLVLIAIACNSISQAMNDPANRNKYVSVLTPIEEDYIFIKLLPLSDIVGLPRTTVRRKVEKLVELGYIEHRRGAGYRIVKRKMAETPVINQILSTQYELISRLVSQMKQREMLPSGGLR
jgi:hypothetical protein